MQASHRPKLVQNAASILSVDRAYRSATTATNSSRVAMLIRPMPAPAEHRQGANYVRQQTDTGSISGEAMRSVLVCGPRRVRAK